jgi:hypothetical protein
MHRNVGIDIGLGWTKQNPGWTNGRGGENQSEGKESKRANGRRGDLSRAIERRGSEIHGRRHKIQYVE